MRRPSGLLKGAEGTAGAAVLGVCRRLAACWDDHRVGLRGQARLVRTGEAALDDIAKLARRYGDGDPARFRGQERVTFEISVERTFEYGS